MAINPPYELIQAISQEITELLRNNPAASMSESFIQHTIEFGILRRKYDHNYYLRIGINYHGEKVQHLAISDDTNKLVGWNPDGDPLGTGENAKLRLANHTIFPRDPDEQLMSDTKIGGGNIPEGRYVRVEFKARGWLGKTKNLDGKQLLKDMKLLANDQADLLVICLSETAHLKWRGEGPAHQVARRTGLDLFRNILLDPTSLAGNDKIGRDIQIEVDSSPEQSWRVEMHRVVADNTSIMPGAIHYVTLCWRIDVD